MRRKIFTNSAPMSFDNDWYFEFRCLSGMCSGMLATGFRGPYRSI